ncbi:MAG: phosphoenolpyruvate carboxykinase (GTP) [Candidatus Altiarchaeota archaeon]|nr:phosphoenolpyruvate carboxykinase (GTP) [Candidatus Altiarchaeota archaeon]
MLEKVRGRLGEEGYRKLSEIRNKRLHRLIEEYIELCNPSKVFVCDDSPRCEEYIREQAIRKGEERKLSIKGHTVHFDGYNDQARDKRGTMFLIPKDIESDSSLNAIDRDEGLREIRGIIENIMEGKELIIKFFCLGPVDSEFSIPAAQLTDSAYVAHSEGLLYRPGYEQFRKIGESERFFFLVHSAGELEKGVSKNIDGRRVYIDMKENIVYSANTQYGGNTIGLKKLSMRLAIHLASHEGWLTEHMLVMGAHGPNDRVTYLLGAFPSMCGKTSTSMMPGETIVGDDIAYLRKMDGELRAVNVERGVFGVIGGINSRDDPIIYQVLTHPGEIIFSNILVNETGEAYWVGKNGRIPTKGFNHSGEWFLGKLDSEGVEIPPSHPNARFTFDMKLLPNIDSRIDDPQGVEVGGIIYGGRDSHTSVPVMEAFNWEHGILIMGASLESETTAATLGKSGVRKLDPMSNHDFLSIPLSRYIWNYLDFGKGLRYVPKIFAVNYFLRDFEGNPLTDKVAKRVWLKWMELRVHEDVEAIKTPVGLIPRYEDLKPLFKKVVNQGFKEEAYAEIFTIRVPENLSRIERVKEFYREKVLNTPEALLKALEEQEKRLEKAREEYGYYITPEKFI